MSEELIQEAEVEEIKEETKPEEIKKEEREVKFMSILTSTLRLENETQLILPNVITFEEAIQSLSDFKSILVENQKAVIKKAQETVEKVESE